MATSKRLCWLLLLLLPSAAVAWSGSATSVSKIQIQVCQNKDCCRNFLGESSLVDTLQDLLPPPAVAAGITVQETGCLSRCDTGPNVCIQTGKKTVLLHGVENAVAASVNLQQACDIQVPPKLLAAANVMEKAQKASSMDEKDRFLSSVIQALRADASLAGSLAIAHALVLRAAARSENTDSQGALQDAQEALCALRTTTTPLSVTWQSQAWRIAADSQVNLGDLPAAVGTLEEWASVAPSFRTKLTREIERLKAQGVAL